MKNSFLLILCFASCVFIFSSVNAENKKNKIVFLGDSLTEGYGLEKESSYPALIQKKLDEKKMKYEVVNSGISGSTTAGGVSRMEWLLKSHPQVMVVALGANDALRGVDVKETKKNLELIIEKAQKEHVKVLLAGMLAPPNYGKKYADAFAKIYVDLEKKYKIPRIPFLLEGVAGKSNLHLADQIHPNEKGYQIVADTVWKYLEKIL